MRRRFLGFNRRPQGRTSQKTYGVVRILNVYRRLHHTSSPVVRTEYPSIIS